MYSDLISVHSIGTTKKGIGPAYSSKASRSGLRVHHLYDPELFESKFRKLVEGRFKRYGHFEYDTEGEIARYKVCVAASARAVLSMLTERKYAQKAFSERLRPHIVDGITFIHKALAANKRILVEGANALMLDLDFGTYPFVTSSSTAIGGVSTGLGVPPNKIGDIIGVVKAYTTRVGAGPFPTELLDVSGRNHFNPGERGKC
jgi:adenylosuccinate synthase